LSAGGYHVHIVTQEAEVPAELRRQRFDLLLISDGAVNGTVAKLALDTEKRGVKTVVMTTTQSRLDALRASGLICFRAPDDVEGLRAAICDRI
jgi:hypothetical protein